MKRDRRGLSPIVATIILIGLTVAAATPIAVYLAEYYAPVRPRRTDLAVYAGLINENLVRFHIQHIGGETIRFRADEPTTAVLRGWAGPLLDNELYGWTFERADRFRQGEWAYAEVQLPGAGFMLGDLIRVQIVRLGTGVLFDDEVTIESMERIPGG